jgi:protein-L-isoaspartate(D-aspartate) O-methyltransferase
MAQTRLEYPALMEGLLDDLGYDDLHIRRGDGTEGWPQEAPFDAITVTAAPEEIPQRLIRQLADGGRMVIPVGDMYPELQVSFVPMTGGAQGSDHR